LQKEFAAKDKFEIIQSKRVASAGGRKAVWGIAPALRIMGEISLNIFKIIPPLSY
jgi:hypothetical protein